MSILQPCSSHFFASTGVSIIVCPTMAVSLLGEIQLNPRARFQMSLFDD